MNLQHLQKTVDEWVRAHGGYWDSFQILARLTEELGEIAADLQRLEGLRPRKVDVDLEAEVGDLLFTLIAFENRRNIRLDNAIDKTLDKYQSRDSEAWRAQQTQTSGP